jgi:putative two-component system response regulator
MEDLDIMENSKVLIVDDQQANVMLLEQILGQAGYKQVVSTTDSREVLGLYKQHAPDLVLLDLNMPHMDGFEIMDQLREVEKGSYIPVLVLTAVDHPSIRHRALDSGARDFISKPFDVSEVLCRMRNMLEVRVLHNQIRNQNQRLEQEVAERTRELEETRMEVIHRLGRAGEYRDNETGNHVIRMSRFSELLAREIGLSERTCNLILNASPMHDIGKIGIPDSILLKPGKLEPDEWETMKTHVIKGVEILMGNDSELMVMARNIALHHHEKWDGSGYPNNLNGQDISIEGRIVAVCDVFDALTSERPYKKAWPVEKALEFLMDQKGRHFEPRLVDGFIRIMPRVQEVQEQYADTFENVVA